MQFTGTPANITRNLRTIVGALDFAGAKMQYWLTGSIVTQVIVEDASTALSQDFGFGTNTCGSETPCKSLHPMTVLTFYAGWPGVKVEFITENEWTTKLQEQSYTIVLKTDDASRSLTQVFTQAVVHLANTRWRKTYWSGTQPGAIWVDYNLSYIVASKAIPNYDTSIVLSQIGVCDELYMNSGNCTAGGGFSGSRHSVSWYSSNQYLFGTAWSGGTPGSGDAYGGQWREDMGGGGGAAGEYGPYPRWYIRYLYAMNSTRSQARDLILPLLGNADAVGQVPIHYRELATGRKYDSAGAVDAFGKTLSIDARPGFSTYDPTNTGSFFTDNADKITYVGTLTNGTWNGLPGSSVGSPDNAYAHFTFTTYVPYLITGDWYLLREMQEIASWQLAAGLGSVAGYNNWSSRHGSWGLAGGQVRAHAWQMRNLVDAYVISPDSTPEKAYFKQKLDNNLAMLEGRLNMTTGNYYQACTSSPFSATTETSIWCYGLKRRNFLSDSGMTDTYDTNPLHYIAISSAGCTIGSSTYYEMDCAGDTYAAELQWQQNYYHMTLGHTAELYSAASPAQQLTTQWTVNASGSAGGHNPWLNDTYLVPMLMNSNSHHTPTSWTQLMNGYTVGPDPNGRIWRDKTALSYYNTSNAAADSLSYAAEHDYDFIARAAVSFGSGVTTPEGNSGLTVYNWIRDSEMGPLGLNGEYATNPKWAISPRLSCDMNRDGRIDVVDVQLALLQELSVCASGGPCSSVGVQAVIAAALGGVCTLQQ
jgi:hypothetical protein